MGESSFLLGGLWAFSLCRPFTRTKMLLNKIKETQKPQKYNRTSFNIISIFTFDLAHCAFEDANGSIFIPAVELAACLIACLFITTHSLSSQKDNF